jgi:ribosomal protein L37AE/L43A
MSHVRTVWRAFGMSSEVWQCQACGVTVTQAAVKAASQAGARPPVGE